MNGGSVLTLEWYGFIIPLRNGMIDKRKKEKNDMANAKKYDDLTFTDDFMFCKVMTTNPELCHELLTMMWWIRFTICLTIWL